MPRHELRDAHTSSTCSRFETTNQRNNTPLNLPKRPGNNGGVESARESQWQTSSTLERTKRSSRQGKPFSKRQDKSVVLARDLRQVISACEQGSFDVGIVGQALPAMEKLRVTDTLRRLCSSIRILEFHDAIKPDVETADAQLRVADTRPEDLGDSKSTCPCVPQKRRSLSLANPPRQPARFRFGPDPHSHQHKTHL
jgi:hypothetical protein